MSPASNTFVSRSGALLPLRACLLSGGRSRRMGRDKALLPHPTGRTWLEHTLQQLAALEAPITVLSRWPEHIARAKALALPQLKAVIEPPPWEGPLLALQRLMVHHPDQRLLLCPVDMPGLKRETLEALLQAAGGAPTTIHIAHDGERSQPLLGIYASDQPTRRSLELAILRGERRLQKWLAGEVCRDVQLEAESIQNINHSDELAQLDPP